GCVLRRLSSVSHTPRGSCHAAIATVSTGLASGKQPPGGEFLRSAEQPRVKASTVDILAHVAEQELVGQPLGVLLRERHQVGSHHYHPVGPVVEEAERLATDGENAYGDSLALGQAVLLLEVVRQADRAGVARGTNAEHFECHRFALSHATSPAAI